MGGSWGALGPLLAALGAVLVPLGSLLAPPGPLLRLIVASRGPSWKLFGALVEALLENDENIENHCFSIVFMAFRSLGVLKSLQNRS